MTAVVRGRPTPSAPLSEAVRVGVHAAAVTILRTAVENTAEGWNRHPAGPSLWQVTEGLVDGLSTGRPMLAEGVERSLSRAIAGWQVSVLEQVRSQGQGRWSAARAAGVGVEGTAVLLMLLALGRAQQPPGPIVEVARRVLSVILGDNQDALTVAVHAELVRCVGESLDTERERFAQALDRVGVRDDLAVALRTHLRAIERAR
jgi:hypothetical protein